MNLYGNKIFFVLISVCFSSERLTCNANSNCEKPPVPRESGKSVFCDIIQSRRENFHTSCFNLISQKTKKHNGKSVSNSSQKTFQYLKGFSVTVLFQKYWTLGFSRAVRQTVAGSNSTGKLLRVAGVLWRISELALMELSIWDTERLEYL